MRPVEFARFVAAALHLNRMSRATPEQVAAIQRDRLNALVRLAVERSPFYRRKYAGVRLDRFRLADLPPTSKPELMAHFEDALTVRDLRFAELRAFMDDPANVAATFRGRYVLSHTSGSQGQPILVVQDRSCLDLFFQLQMTRGNAGGRGGLLEGIRRLVRPARLAVIILERGFYPSAATFAHVPPASRPFVRVLAVSMTDPALVDRLNAFRPTVLAGYANVLAQLADDAEAGRLRLQDALRHVVNHSETLSDALRERLRAVFRVPVLNNYATAECPFLSNGCSTDPGSHINADWCIVEVVDDAYRPVPPGAAGQKVLVTNLANQVQPFIRYEVSDVVTLAAEPCRCGSRLPRIAGIDGRRSEAFCIQAADGGYRTLSPFIFKKALLHTYEVREWQAVQHARNAITLRLEVLPGAVLDVARLRAALDQHLELYGFAGLIDVGLEQVAHLESDPRTGKFRQTVSLVGPPPAG